MSTGLGLFFLGLFIHLSVIMCLDYHEYIRGGKSIFFKDKTDTESMLREIQDIEIQNKLRELRRIQ